MIETHAALLRGREEPFALEPVRLREPGPGELLVRIACVGLCHTDLFPRQPHAPVTFPLVAGHEGAGVVEALGPETKGIEVGDHVLLSFDSCAGCVSCRTANPAYCDEFFERNLTGRRMDGSTTMLDAHDEAVANRWFGQSSFAAHSLVDARNVIPVDPDLPLELLAPLACGFQTGAGAILVALGVPAGARVLILGAGAVGLAAVMGARLAGAGTIVVVEPHANRRRLAEELGADEALAPPSGALGERASALAGAFDYAVDTTGNPAAVSDAVELLTPRGVLGLVGIPTGDLTLGRRALAVGRTITGILEGSVVPRVFIPQLIEHWRQGRFPIDRLVESFPLSEINEAVAAASDGEVVKPVLVAA